MTTKLDEMTNEPKRRVVAESIEDVIAAAEARMWEIYRRCGEPYGGVYAQLEDMIELGKLAARVKLLRDAQHAMFTALPTVRKEA